jgi:hypothetical protein
MEAGDSMKKYITILMLGLSLSVYGQTGNAPIRHNQFTTNPLPVLDLNGLTISNLVALYASQLVVTQLIINNVTITNTQQFIVTNFVYQNNEQFVLFSGSTNFITLVNTNVYLAILSGNGALTNIGCTNPFTFTKMMLSNSSAITNTFTITAAGRKIGAVTTNVITMFPGKVYWISIRAQPGVLTQYCTVPEL